MADLHDRERSVEFEIHEPQPQRRVGKHLALIITIVSLATVLGAAPFLIQLLFGR